MQPLATLLETTLTNRPGSLRASDSEPYTPPRPSARSKAHLAALLEKVCALQKAYGKTNAELETLVEGFSWALVGYPETDINRAFQRYIVGHSDIPAPADIIKIIKEFQQLDGVTPPSIEQLRQYRDRGIPLTPRQQAQLLGPARPTFPGVSEPPG